MGEVVAIAAGVHAQVARHGAAGHVLARLPELAFRHIQSFQPVGVVQREADLDQLVTHEDAADAAFQPYLVEYVEVERREPARQVVVVGQVAVGFHCQCHELTAVLGELLREGCRAPGVECHPVDGNAIGPHGNGQRQLGTVALVVEVATAAAYADV